MAQYLIKHFKGKYRLRCHYDLDTNDFSRNAEGKIEGHDVYIDCYKGTEICHYGGKTFKCYVPSLGRGRNIIRALKEMGKQDIVEYYTETDQEVVFRFHIKYMDIIADLVKPKTGGAGISPYSVRNLPKKDKPKWNTYKPQDKDTYNQMMGLLKQWISKQGVQLGKAYNKFYQEFGEFCDFNFVEVSKNKNYKPLHIIDLEDFTDVAIKWLENNS